MREDKYDVYSEYGESSNKNKIIVIAILLIIVGTSGYLVYTNYDQIKTTIITQYHKKFPSNNKTNEDNSYQIIIPNQNIKIYDMKEIVSDLEKAKVAEYVRATPNLMIYLGTEEALVFNYVKEPDGKINYYIIDVDKVIDAEGKVKAISDCRKNNVIKSCLIENNSYIISEPDNAIIDESYFDKNVLSKEANSI